MWNDNNLSFPLISKTSADIAVLNAIIRDGYSLERGQVVTVELVAKTARTLNQVTIEVQIYNPEGQRVYSSSPQKIQTLAAGKTCLHVYFLMTLPKGCYALTFKISKEKIYDENINGKLHNYSSSVTKSLEFNEDLENSGQHVLCINNLFVEFSVKDNKSKINEDIGSNDITRSDLQIAANVMLGPQEGLAGTTDNIYLTFDFPWPLEKDAYTNSEITDTFAKVFGAKSGSSKSLFSLMTPRCSPRIFTPNLPRFMSQVGELYLGKIRSTAKGGFLAFGFYIPIATGNYCVTLYGSTVNEKHQTITFDVVAKRSRVNLGSLTTQPMTSNSLEISLNFDIPTLGHNDVEFRIKINAEIEIEINHLILVSRSRLDEKTAFEMMDWIDDLLAPVDIEVTGIVAHRKKYRDIAFSNPKHLKLAKTSGTSVIFVPNDVFLPFCLSVADYFYKKHNRQSILIYYDWSPFYYHAVLCSNSLSEIWGYLEFLDFAKTNKIHVETFISHSFGWEDVISEILTNVTATEFFVYGDGFKQSVQSTYNKYHRISGAISFGSIPVGLEERIEEVISPFTVIECYKKLSTLIPIKRRLRSFGHNDSYAVVYLRYYGADPYNFHTSIAIHIALQTIVGNLGTVQSVVIKNDPRVPEGVFTGLISALRSKGLKAISLEDYLLDKGENPCLAAIPAEYLFLNGYLCDASLHICFDSTVCYSIAAMKEYIATTTILVGANLDFIRYSQVVPGGYLVSLESSCNEDHLFLPNESIETIKVCSNILATYIIDNSILDSLKMEESSTEDIYTIRVDHR